MKLGGFQKITLLIAIILLIIILIVIATALLSGKYNNTWPPVTPECPDWWISDGSGNKQRCFNQKKLGICKKKKKNFNTSEFSGSQGACNKYKWANECKVSWDGITYGIPNPCNS
jgi:hypothetical protein